jgi:hypothetical protein
MAAMVDSHYTHSIIGRPKVLHLKAAIGTLPEMDHANPAALKPALEPEAIVPLVVKADLLVL